MEDRGIKVPGVTSSCEPSEVGAGNLTWIEYVFLISESLLWHTHRYRHYVQTRAPPGGGEIAVLMSQMSGGLSNF